MRNDYLLMVQDDDPNILNWDPGLSLFLERRRKGRIVLHFRQTHNKLLKVCTQVNRITKI